MEGRRWLCLRKATSRQGSRPKILRRARSFYAEKLGLEPVEERPGGLRYRCGNGEFALFESAGAAAGDHTQMAWEVDDLKEAIAELRERGAIFEEYHVPGPETVNRIAEAEGNHPGKGGRRGEDRLVQGQRGQPTCHRSSRDPKYSAACGQPAAFCRATPKTQAETVIRQIPRICAAQLTSAPGPLSEQNGGSGTQVARHQVTRRDGRDGSASLLSSQAMPSFRLGEAAGQLTDVTGAD
jgi:catechol 2,3-dioxygenase-like lactoylglutathione lyase family enzyme